ncbi:MAG: hypothetical protein WDN46_22405 [Methylocella sp.]
MILQKWRDIRISAKSPAVTLRALLTRIGRLPPRLLDTHGGLAYIASASTRVV